MNLATLEEEIQNATVQNNSLKPFNVWSPGQFLAWTEPPGSHLLLPTFVTKGELTTLIGQGGLGKTRLALWLPICQITGRDWCGVKTGGEPQKWLMLGDENSVSRIKGDLEKILPNLSAVERGEVEELLRVQAVLGFEDADLNLGDVTTQARVMLTVEQEAPGGVVVDPLVNFAPGDISKPGEMKEAIRLLLYTVRKAAPTAAIFLLHHARPGRANIAQGIGWDAGNFASGGKSLFAAARCQINLMPGASDDDTRLVMSCGKANNCPRFEPRGLVFDPLKFTYTVDPNFDPDTWRSDVEGRARATNSLCTVGDIVAAVRDGFNTTAALVENIMATYRVSQRTAARHISKAIESRGILQLARGKYALGSKSEKFLTLDTYK